MQMRRRPAAEWLQAPPVAPHRLIRPTALAASNDEGDDEQPPPAFLLDLDARALKPTLALMAVYSAILGVRAIGGWVVDGIHQSITRMPRWTTTRQVLIHAS